MKLTKQQLKRIIKEELENVLEDQTGEEYVIERVGVSSDERYYVGYIYKDGRYEGVYGSKEEARKFSTKAKADRALPLLQKRDGYEYTVGPTSLESSVPQEAKEKIFADMVKRNLVPEGGTIEDAEFWEVNQGDYGYESAVVLDGKYYYGEI